MLNFITDYAVGLKIKSAPRDLLDYVSTGMSSKDFFWAGTRLAGMGGTFNKETVSFIEKSGGVAVTRERLIKFLTLICADLQKNGYVSHGSDHCEAIGRDYIVEFSYKDHSKCMRQWDCIVVKPLKTAAVENLYLKFTLRTDHRPVIVFHD